MSSSAVQGNQFRYGDPVGRLKIFLNSDISLARSVIIFDREAILLYINF